MIPCGENSKVALTVKNFIAAHRIPHAMLIEGENEWRPLDVSDYKLLLNEVWDVVKGDE